MTATMNLTDILDKIYKDTKDSAKLEVREIIKALRYRGYGPLILAASLLTIMPTGAIPGVPTITALIIILIAGRMALGFSSPWLPKPLMDLSIEQDKFDSARETVLPYTKKFDRFIRPRLKFMTFDIFNRIIAVLCMGLALTIPPLEFIPFAAFVPACAIALFGIGLSGKDGLFVIAGFIVSIGGGTAIYLLR